MSGVGNMPYHLAAPCLFGLEGPLAEELRQLGAQNVSAENGRVFFDGGEEMIVRANLCSRFAERILIAAARFTARSFTELFDGVNAVSWSDYIGSNDAFPVTGHCVSSALHSVPDCQKIIKKSIAVSLSRSYGVERLPEGGAVHQIRFSIIKDDVLVAIDTSGAGLHKRGYRPVSNAAPIRETLAAALCSFSKLRHYHALYDPFCGSGTVLTEGALLANNIAPGLGRRFAADEWGLVDGSLWQRERERAKSLEKKDTDFIAFGSDISPQCVKLTFENAERAGVSRFMRVKAADISDFEPQSENGTLVTNPPYGERMLDTAEAQRIYGIMGKKFLRRRGWSFGIISPDEEFEAFFGRKADKTRKLYNGMLRCRYYMYFK